MIIIEFFSSMLEFSEYDGYTEVEKIQFILKWILSSLIFLRIPMCFISLIAIINTIIEFLTIIIGILGVVYLKKVFLVSYCTLSEISFFLSSYGICSFLSSSDQEYYVIKISIGSGLKIFFVVLFILWSLLMFYSIKLILDLFQTSESKPLLFSFSASSIDPNSNSPSTEQRMV